MVDMKVDGARSCRTVLHVQLVVTAATLICCLSSSISYCVGSIISLWIAFDQIRPSISKIAEQGNGGLQFGPGMICLCAMALSGVLCLVFAIATVIRSTRAHPGQDLLHSKPFFLASTRIKVAHREHDTTSSIEHVDA